LADVRTFADDSFKIEDPAGLVVLGQLPEWSELRWYAELKRVCGDDLKWRKVRRSWDDLSAELRRTILRDLREALITIVDPRGYRAEFDRALDEVIGLPRSSWTPYGLQWASAERAKYEMHRIVGDSPATKIEHFLSEDPPVLGDLHLDERSSVLSDVQESLKEPHTVRLFGARSAAAFSVLSDRALLDEVIAELHPARYYTTGTIYARLLARGELTQRVFDEGNRPSVMAIDGLKGSIRVRLSEYSGILIPDTEAGVVERASVDVPMLQAADLAAGYARSLYVAHGGPRVVCQEFKGVIVNGSMVRDWSQMERANLTQLRE